MAAAKNKMMVRMLDIAREAGVSRPLVSAVLTGSAKGKIRVSEETAERIRTIAAKYHFKPNSTAQMLAGKSSNIIGVLVDSYASPYVFEILGCFEELLAKAGYCMLVAQAHDNRNAFRQSLHNFAMYKTAGILAMAHSYPNRGFDLYDELTQHPNVLLAGRPLRDGITLPYVEKDIEGGICQAVEYLYRTGCRRIAINVGQKAYYDIPMTGYRRGLKKCGLLFQEELIFSGLNVKYEAVIEEQAQHLLAVEADAVITSEFHAMQLLSMFYNLNIRVPDRISVISVDSSFMSRGATPALSSIDFSNINQAQMLYNRLMDLIRSGSAQSELLPSKLILRRTTKNIEGDQ